MPRIGTGNQYASRLDRRPCTVPALLRVRGGMREVGQILSQYAKRPHYTIARSSATMMSPCNTQPLVADTISDMSCDATLRQIIAHDCLLNNNRLALEPGIRGLCNTRRTPAMNEIVVRTKHALRNP
ncbi:hypothetical protein J6590_010142 [Homalodisca vitripennis]|nr:hypothetical protein J6590_010142 [Homalodisca vitripennis]